MLCYITYVMLCCRIYVMICYKREKNVMLYNMICVIVCVMFSMLHNMCHVIEQNKAEHIMLYNKCVNMLSYIIYVIICYNYITRVMLCYKMCHVMLQGLFAL